MTSKQFAQVCLWSCVLLCVQAYSIRRHMHTDIDLFDRKNLFLKHLLFCLLYFIYL